ncbi:tetratricopeptide repeat protein [Candidatus Sumerlaeota bacterium]|nr:tetratricopeptide repeat protein [Candidatus Sumerlaeota bacterium]
MATTSKRNTKISRQELETNEVLEATDHLAIFLRIHGQKILIGASIVLVIYIGFVLWNQKKEGRLREASDRYFAISQDYEKAMNDSQWGTTERKDGMKKVIAEAEQIQKDFANTAVARNALYLQANAYFYSGDDLGTVTNTQEAIKLFTEYADKAAQEGDDFEQAGALLALGYAQENLSVLSKATNEAGSKQALAAAMEYYDRVVKLPKAGFLKYAAMNSKARILNEVGQRDKAIELYKQVVKENREILPVPAADANERDRRVYAVRSAVDKFTTAGDAITELNRLGVPLEEILPKEEVDAMKSL